MQLGNPVIKKNYIIASAHTDQFRVNSALRHVIPVQYRKISNASVLTNYVSISNVNHRYRRWSGA